MKGDNMTKAELIMEIAEKAGFTKSQAEAALDATFETITELMIKQEKILISGFGGFSTKVRAERKGRNPATGKEMTIPESVVVTFKPAAQLKKTINQ